MDRHPPEPATAEPVAPPRPTPCNPLPALLLAGAGLLFMLVYVPERERANRLEQSVREARAYLENLARREARLEELADALEHGEPTVLAETIREQLFKGGPGEYVAVDMIEPDAHAAAAPERRHRR